LISGAAVLNESDARTHLTSKAMLARAAKDILIVTNCSAAMLDSNAVRCFRRERGFHHGFYEGSNFRFIIPRYSFVGCTPSDKRAGQRHPEKQQPFPGRPLRRCHIHALTRDMGFNGTISGSVHAQPLYIEGGPGGPMVIVVTASNTVYALNATTGTAIWQRNDLGPPVTSDLPCGNISPFGIIGTPVIDLASRSLFFNAMIDGTPKKHFVFSLNVDTGETNPGWPVDRNAQVPGFTSSVQNERGALAI
jgi:hypothetical protein